MLPRKIFFTLPVYLENKQSLIVLYTLRYSEISTEGRGGFYDLQKHKKICIFMIFNPDFENSKLHFAIYITFVKIIFFVYNEVAFTVNVLHIC